MQFNKRDNADGNNFFLLYIFCIVILHKTKKPIRYQGHIIDIQFLISNFLYIYIYKYK